MKRKQPDVEVIENANGTYDVLLSDKIANAMAMPEPTSAEQIAMMKNLVGEDMYKFFTS